MATRIDLGIAMGSGPQFTRWTIPYTDLTAAALVQSVNLFTLNQGGIILGVRIKHTTAFAGTAWSATTVSVGWASDYTAFASAFDIFQAVADTTLQNTSEFKCVTNAAAGTAVVARFTSVGGNLSAGTAGAVNIDVLYLQPSVAV